MSHILGEIFDLIWHLWTCNLRLPHSTIVKWLQFYLSILMRFYKVKWGKYTFFKNFSKQWLLAVEFSEFEYSRETSRFWRVRVLAKTAVFWNVRDSPDSPTFAKPCCADSPDSQTFAKSWCADSPDSPTFAKPCCADSPDSRKASLASFTRI